MISTTQAINVDDWPLSLVYEETARGGYFYCSNGHCYQLITIQVDV